jgi:ubiquinone/menaquinone biosynthesis C-methylase UbiE
MEPSEKTDYAPLAKSYAQHRKPHPVVLARLREQLRPDSRLLELGCGTGNFITSLRQDVGCDCVGIDPSAEMLAQLRARGSDVTVLQNSAERLELPAESFDLVYSVDVIHHVEGLTAAFAEVMRVLRPGGQVVTVTDSEWVIRNRLQSHYFPESIDVELERYPSMARLRAELAQAGLQEVREELVEHQYELTSAASYRAKVYSSLLYISDEAFQRGLQRLEADLQRGPVVGVARYVLLWGRKPATV